MFGVNNMKFKDKFKICPSVFKLFMNLNKNMLIPIQHVLNFFF